ncbi:MAG: hypothetical protein ACR2I2_10050 [Bryobacteraceae bacterium]
MKGLFLGVFSAVLLGGLCIAPASAAPAGCKGVTVQAEVAAIEHAYQYNRFGSFNPAGLIFALQQDLVPQDVKQVDEDAYFAKYTVEQLWQRKLQPGKVRLRRSKRPRPLVLRVNEDDCLEVHFTNLLSPLPPVWTNLTVPEHALSPNDSTARVPFVMEESPYPATREVSLHVNGLEYMGSIESDGAFVGNNPNSNVKPGGAHTYKWYARKEGGFLLYSTAATTGGEGDGGQIELGLFGAVNVEPKGAKWYRSQVTHDVLVAASPKRGKDSDYTHIDYSKIAILDSANRILHSDLNAVIVQDPKAPKDKGEQYCGDEGPGQTCGLSFREFTVIFHDEINAVQSFAELGDETNPIASVKDGMGINYGVSSMGAPVLANLKKIGPAAKCAECKFEEFFLSSWANGDPALLPQYEDDPSNVHHAYLGDPVRFRNMHAGPKETHVFHLHAHQWLYDHRDPRATYLDSQTISPGASYTYAIQYGGAGNRNFTVGDSIFHCHLYPHFAQGMWELWRAHDVFEDGTKGVWDGETNPRGRWLPDGEIAEGTPNPAVVPIPGRALAPLPGKEFGGYPFFIPGRAGHRPPQPPLDMDIDEKGEQLSGGLSRHLVLEGEAKNGTDDPDEEKKLFSSKFGDGPSGPDAVTLGSKVAEANANRVMASNSNSAHTLFAKKLTKATIHRLPWEGTPGEQTAMRFHQGLLASLDFHGTPGKADPLTTPQDHSLPFAGEWWKGMGYWSPVEGGGKTMQFGVNGRIGEWMRSSGNPEPKSLGMPGAPYADPCPTGTPLRKYRAAYIQLDMTVNKWGWHDPQARIAVLEKDVKDTIELRRPTEPLFFRANSGECIQFAATNLVPSALNLDDFQIFSPTDTLGQHIHLVKFDVTSSDGSANGWNYEDGTLSADEVRERIAAHNAANPGDPIGLKTHPIFKVHGALENDKRGWCADMPGGSDKNPWCGAQTTVQRWYADPVFDRNKNDRTLRTVFTHDHFGPSSHQHHGLYAALVIEPTDSTWKTLDGSRQLGTGRNDGGPTSYRANIEVRGDPSKNRREFTMAFADFALLYTTDLEPVNPPNRSETLRMPGGADREVLPTPEGISGRDPGTQLINYRQEPVPLRVAEEKNTGFIQRKYADDHYYPENPKAPVKDDPRGNLANVFNSNVHQVTDEELREPRKADGSRNPSLFAALEKQRLNFMEHLNCPQGADDAFKPFYCEVGRKPGDPATPLLTAYEGDRMQVRLVQGAQEEQHIFTMTGVKWLHQAAGEYPHTPEEISLQEHPSPGYVNAQQIGISEHMEFDMPLGVQHKAASDHLYMSSATDNLWDGMWGIARVFGWTTPPGASVPVQNVQPNLAKIVEAPAPPKTADSNIVCAPSTMVVHVGAYLARDLAPDSKGDPDDKVRLTQKDGAFYNSRFQISDPNAIVFVEHDPQYPDDQKEHLREAYRQGKPYEPLILRAPAGACLDVFLHNHIPSDYDDRWKHPDQVRNGAGSGKPAEIEAKVAQHKGTYSLMPPLTDGLNMNQLRSSSSVGLSPQLLELDFRNSMGVDIGINQPSAVQPGETKKFNWYAGEQRLVDGPEGRVVRYLPAEYGAVSLRDLADPIKHTTHGAVGMLIVEPRGSCSTYPIAPMTGTAHRGAHNDKVTKAIREKYRMAGYCEIKGEEDPRMQFMRSKATADVRIGNKISFRDFALLYQDDLSLMQGQEPLPNLRGGDDAEDSGGKAFNYRTEPLWARAGAGSPEVKPEEMQNRVFTNTLSSKAPNAGCGGPCGDPETPVFTAPAGREVRFRVVHPGGHPRQHGFTLFGHSWEDQPWQWEKRTGDSEYTQVMANNTHIAHLGSVSGIGPARHLNLRTCAGGTYRVKGDYLFRTQEAFQFQGGLWGIFRVTDPDGSVCTADDEEVQQQKARTK